MPRLTPEQYRAAYAPNPEEVAKRKADELAKAAMATYHQWKAGHIPHEACKVTFTLLQEQANALGYQLRRYGTDPDANCCNVMAIRIESMRD